MEPDTEDTSMFEQIEVVKCVVVRVDFVTRTCSQEDAKTTEGSSCLKLLPKKLLLMSPQLVL